MLTLVPFICLFYNWSTADYWTYDKTVLIFLPTPIACLLHYLVWKIAIFSFLMGTHVAYCCIDLAYVIFCGYTWFLNMVNNLLFSDFLTGLASLVTSRMSTLMRSLSADFPPTLDGELYTAQQVWYGLQSLFLLMLLSKLLCSWGLGWGWTLYLDFLEKVLEWERGRNASASARNSGKIILMWIILLEM